VRNADVHPADVKRASRIWFRRRNALGLWVGLKSGNAVFLYGPPGVGNNGAAETLSRCVFRGQGCYHTTEAGGQIITVYDPAIHGPDLELIQMIVTGVGAVQTAHGDCGRGTNR